jgi:hypothetical protein
VKRHRKDLHEVFSDLSETFKAKAFDDIPALDRTPFPPAGSKRLVSVVVYTWNTTLRRHLPEKVTVEETSTGQVWVFEPPEDVTRAMGLAVVNGRGTCRGVEVTLRVGSGGRGVVGKVERLDGSPLLLWENSTMAIAAFLSTLPEVP